MTRLVWSSETASRSPSLTGVGRLSQPNVLSAPFNSELSYHDTHELEDITLFQKSGTLWGYGFHDACWKLLLMRLPNVENRSDMLRSIFGLLYNIPCPDFSSFRFGHDYGGAASTQKPLGLPKTVDQSSSLYADPDAIPSLEELESSVLEMPYPASPNGIVPSGSETSDLKGVNGLFSLPPEVLHMIVSYLSLREVVSARLICQFFALVFKRENLPQSFWKSRFKVGSDVDYILPNFTTKRNWSRLFFGTQACLKNGNPSLANRKRIMTLIEPIARLLELSAPGSRELCGFQMPLGNTDEGQIYNPERDYAGDLPGCFHNLTIVQRPASSERL